MSGEPERADRLGDPAGGTGVAEKDLRAPDARPVRWQLALAGILGLALVGAAFLLIQHPTHASALLGPIGGAVLGGTLNRLRTRLSDRAYRIVGTTLGAAILAGGVVIGLAVSPMAWVLAASGVLVIVLSLVRLRRPARGAGSGRD